MIMKYEGIDRSRNEWVNCASRFLMNGEQATVKKINRKTLNKELRMTFTYGMHVAVLDILYKHKDNPMTVDEIVGELQVLLTDTYNDMKTKNLLKIPNFDLETCLEQGYSIEPTANKTD